MSSYPDSNATAELIDQEVRALVDEAYVRTVALMKAKAHQVKLVAELLLEKETITNMDVTRLIGDRPHYSGKEYDEYVKSGWHQQESPTQTPAADMEKKQETQHSDADSNGSVGGSPVMASKANYHL